MNVLEFFNVIAKLKERKRSGWKVSGVKNSESIADHSFGVAVLVMILGKKKNLNLEKALKMALIHDLGESKTGDIITWKNFHATRKEKLKREWSALKEITKDLGETGREILELWREFEEGRSPEAKFVKSIDKFETVLQARVYRKKEKNLNSYIETFFEPEILNEIKDKEVRELLKSNNIV